MNEKAAGNEKWLNSDDEECRLLGFVALCLFRAKRISELETTLAVTKPQILQIFNQDDSL
jgi:hypothetical protein